MISSCWAARPRGSLATSTISVSEGSSASSSRGASRSATTTSASISALRPATEISSGWPGPPPTSTTPGVRARRRRGSSEPSRSPETISSRRLACRRGSRAAAVLPITATVSPSWLPAAGVNAVAAWASSARTQKIRCRSATRPTRRLTSGSSVAAITYQAPSRSASSKARATQVDLARAHESLDRGRHLGRDDDDLGAGRDQRRQPRAGRRGRRPPPPPGDPPTAVPRGTSGSRASRRRSRAHCAARDRSVARGAEARTGATY